MSLKQKKHYFVIIADMGNHLSSNFYDKIIVVFHDITCRLEIICIYIELYIGRIGG